MKTVLSGLFKGGVGKSTQNFMLAHLLSRRGFRVLYVDFDPQCSGTKLFTRNKVEGGKLEQYNILEGMKSEDLLGNIVQVENNLDIIPGNKNVNLFEDIMEKKSIDKFYLYLRAILEPVYESDSYDFVLLDMSPSRSKLNLSVMGAADTHIVVSQTEVMSMEQIQDYLDEIYMLRDDYGVDTDVLGISVGMNDSGTSISKSVVDTIKRKYPELMFNTIIKRRTKIQEYSVTGFPEKNSRNMYNVEDRNAIVLYEKLMDEILNRLGFENRKDVRENG